MKRTEGNAISPHGISFVSILFFFDGLEGDGVERSNFTGSIRASTVSNLDVGSLYKGALGGEGGVVGGAVTQSFRTGKGGSVFGGGSLSAGPFGGPAGGDAFVWQ